MGGEICLVSPLVRGKISPTFSEVFAGKTESCPESECPKTVITNIIMPVERSAGIIIYKNTPHGRKYLVLHASRNVSRVTRFKVTRDFWDFAKGVLDKGETAYDAARREAYEEAGIKKFIFAEDFKETAHYFTRRHGKPVPKYVAMFLAEIKNSKIKLSWEHDEYEWLPYKEAYKRITLPQMKEALKKAEKFLNRA